MKSIKCPLPHPPLDKGLEFVVDLSLFLIPPPPLLSSQLHVHGYFVLDGLCSVTKLQSGLGLCCVVGAGRTADDERGASIAPQTLLEHSGQLAVSIGDVGFLKEREHNKLLEMSQRTLGDMFPVTCCPKCCLVYGGLEKHLAH